MKAEQAKVLLKEKLNFKNRQIGLQGQTEQHLEVQRML